MESKKINQLATELAPELSDLTIIGDPTTGISKKITLSQMASLFTGTVEEYASLSAFPLVGTADTIYIALDTNILYRWNTGTSAYVELSPNVVSSLVFNDANGFDGTISLVGSVATLTITTALTQGSVPFIGASGALTQDNTNFFWDNSNKRLGINTNTPTGALDVFGSGIIGRLNGTSTNNAFLGFASAGSNKWSIGNVQSDHRFRIYNEAATSELFTVLPTGEIGIGIANPLTKLHIDGGASALIANLDANVSVAKSVSFRSDNSSRFNIEVSGTESGSNAGADFFIRRYSDAGALIDTPLTITRATGAISLTNALNGTTASFSGALSSNSLTLTSTQTNLVLNTTTNTSFSKLSFQDNGVEKGTILYANSAFAATSRRDKLEISNIGGINFITQNAPLTPDMVITSSGNVSIGNTNNTFKLDVSGTGRFTGNVGITTSSSAGFSVNSSSTTGFSYIDLINSGTSGRNYQIGVGGNATAAGYTNNLYIDLVGVRNVMTITPTGNVGIGTSSPTARVTIYGGELKWGFTSDFGALSYTDGKPMLASVGALDFLFYTNATERGRFNAAGSFKASTNGTYLNSGAIYHELRQSATDTNLAIFTHTAASPYGPELFFTSATPNNTTNYFLTCTDSTNTKAQIYSNGTFGSRTGTYGSIVSDEKFKTEIQDANSQWEDIKKLRVVNFKLKEDVELEGENALRQIGFIAQEVEKVSPNLVYIAGRKDSEETWKSVKTSIIEIKAIKALQEAMKRIEILEEKIKQLESK
jgi:hypothetical protein